MIFTQKFPIETFKYKKSFHIDKSLCPTIQWIGYKIWYKTKYKINHLNFGGSTNSPTAYLIAQLQAFSLNSHFLDYKWETPRFPHLQRGLGLLGPIKFPEIYHFETFISTF